MTSSHFSYGCLPVAAHGHLLLSLLRSCSCFLGPAPRGKGLRLTCPSRLCAACRPCSTLSESAEPPSLRPPENLPFHRRWLLKRGVSPGNSEGRKDSVFHPLWDLEWAWPAEAGALIGHALPILLISLPRLSPGDTVLRKWGREEGTQALCKLCLQIQADPMLVKRQL